MFPPRFVPAKGPPPISSRQRVLSQWRGFDVRSVENCGMGGVRATKALMPGVLKELRIDNRRVEAEVVKVWNNLIDPVIAAHAQPVGLKKGTLFINVDSSVWLDEIVRYRRKELLSRLQHSFGSAFITRLSIRVG